VESTTVSGCCTGLIKYYNHIGLQNEVLAISLFQKVVDFLPFLGALASKNWMPHFLGLTHATEGCNVKTMNFAQNFGENAGIFVQN
jgi:hypothetical protein